MFESECLNYTAIRTPWWLQDSSVDLNFALGKTWTPTAGETGDFTQLLSCSRASGGYATDSDGTLKYFTDNILRMAGSGLLIEDARTNVCLWNRDLTNAAWVKTTMTAALDQVGADGGINAASSLLATAGNATALQSITLASSARAQSAYIKRLVGTGTINMTMDNGTTWTVVAAWDFELSRMATK